MPLILTPDASGAVAIPPLPAGGLVVFPTETVYGLGCRLDDAAGIGRIFALKGRNEGKPLAAYLADPAGLAAVLVVDRTVERLARAFLPGPLTIVGRAARPLHPRLLSGGGRVGVRVPAHPACRALLAATGPLAATSANRSGGASPAGFADLDPAVLGGADLAIDCGRLAFGRESTVVDVSSGTAVVLRAGCVPEAEILRAADGG